MINNRSWLLCGMSIIAFGQTLDMEAKAEADRFWRPKFSTCSGDTSAIGYGSGQIRQLVGLSWDLRSESISSIQAQNGLQWKGATTLRALRTRAYMPARGGWQPWEQGTGFGAFNVFMKKENGRWTLTPNDFSAIPQMFAVPCANVPPDKTKVQILQEQTAQQSQACRQALAGDSNFVESLINTGIDLNQCTDGYGRNVLMVLPIQNRSMWQGDAMNLIKSGKLDLNRKDRFGYTALHYGLIRFGITAREGSDSYLKVDAMVIDALVDRGLEVPGWMQTQPNRRVDLTKVPRAFPQ